MERAPPNKHMQRSAQRRRFAPFWPASDTLLRFGERRGSMGYGAKATRNSLYTGGVVRWLGREASRGRGAWGVSG